MPQHYMDPSNANDPHRLPNILTMLVAYAYCGDCGSLVLSETGAKRERCQEPGCDDNPDGAEVNKVAWFYWFCLPGCLPDSEPVGPFETEEAALADARSDMEEME